MKPPLRHLTLVVLCLLAAALSVAGTDSGDQKGAVDDQPVQEVVVQPEEKPDTKRNRVNRQKQSSKNDTEPAAPNTLGDPFGHPDLAANDTDDYDGFQSTQQLSARQRDLTCTPDICDDADDVHMTLSTAGGAMVPTGVTVILRCTVSTPHDEPAEVSWHPPSRVAHRIHLTDDPAAGREAARRQAAVNATTEQVERRVVGERALTVSILTVPNTTTEDGGLHVCSARLSDRCCHRNGTVTIRVYVPPSYATDLTIVGSVCFVEFLIILYFKTRSERRCSQTGSPANGVYVAQHYEALQRRESKKGFEEM